MKYIFLLIFSLTLITSCDNPITIGKFDEGVIEYDIIYHQSESQNPIISLLPKTMTFKFKDNSTIQQIEGWMGIFSMAGITDIDKGKKSALLKILNKRYHYETELNGISFGFDQIPGMKIESTNETKEILGYVCKKAIVKIVNDKINTSFNIFYTDEIKIETPNKNNPFGEIKGVLLEYQMSFQNIPMSIIATKIEEKDISDDDFKIPSGYESVTMETMQETISSLM